MPHARTYIRSHDAWYHNPNAEDWVYEVMFGEGEAAMRWYVTDRDEGEYPTLVVPDGSFSDLADCAEVIEALRDLDDTCFTPEEFCEVLRALGFKDETPEANPRMEAYLDSIDKVEVRGKVDTTDQHMLTLSLTARMGRHTTVRLGLNRVMQILQDAVRQMVYNKEDVECEHRD